MEVLYWAIWIPGLALLQRACDLRPVTSCLGLFFNTSGSGGCGLTGWFPPAVIALISESQKPAEWLASEGTSFPPSFLPSPSHSLTSSLDTRN